MPNNSKKPNKPKNLVSGKVVKPAKKPAKKPTKKKVVAPAVETVSPVETTKPTDLVEKWAPVVAEEATQVNVNEQDKHLFVPEEKTLGWFARTKQFLTDLVNDLR